MLDYSDDELEPSVQKRNHSLYRGEDSGIVPQEYPERKDDGSSLHFTAKTQSIYKEFKGRSGIMIPTSNPPATDAFVITEFIPGKTLKPNNEFHKFGLGFKAGAKPIFDKFSPDTEDHPDSFYKSMKTLVLCAQIFGVLPVSGFRGHNYKSLAFKWIDYKMAYWVLVLLGNIFCCVCFTISGLKSRNFETASDITFYGCGILSSILMLSLSRNWRNLNKDFTEVELKLKKYGYPKKLAFKFKIFTFVVLVMALVEHVLAKLQSFEGALACSQQKNGTFGLAKTFFVNEYSEVFAFFSYSLWKGILLLITNFLITANWNLKDLFLCMISWTIAERFKQVNDLLRKVHGQNKPISFWKEVREDFNNLSVLTKRVDAYIKKLMLLSMGNNLFFICIQLFQSFKSTVAAFKLVYVFWSFGYLVLRTGFVAFSAAEINDESKEPKTVLYSVPQNDYTAEVRRFLTQLTTNDVALTGSGFFSITRSLILTITGSVITYEIVLVQFGGNESADNLQSNFTVCKQL